MYGIFKDNVGIVTIRDLEQLFGLFAGAGPDRWALSPDRRRSAEECAGEGCRERYVRVIIPGSPTPKPERLSAPVSATRTIYRVTPPWTPKPRLYDPENGREVPARRPARCVSAILRLRRSSPL